MISWLHHDWAFVRRARDTWERDRDRAVSATSEACAHLDFNWAVTIVTIQQISGWSKTIRLCGRSAPGHTFGGQKFSGSFIFIHLRNLVTAQLQWMLGAPMCSENTSWTVCGGVEWEEVGQGTCENTQRSGDIPWSITVELTTQHNWDNCGATGRNRFRPGNHKQPSLTHNHHRHLFDQNGCGSGEQPAKTFWYILLLTKKCTRVCVCVRVRVRVCVCVCVWTIWIDVKLLICRGPLYPSPGSGQRRAWCRVLKTYLLFAVHGRRRAQLGGKYIYIYIYLYM